MFSFLRSKSGRTLAFPLVLLALTESTECGLLAQAGLDGSAGPIRILIMQGFGAVNFPKTNQTTVPVVAVLDDNDRPVEGATVVFQLPVTGPGASFDGGQLSLTTQTNSMGQAAASGFRANGQAGRFIVRVEATWKGKQASVSFSQVNSLREVPVVSGQSSPRASGSSRKWLIFALILAAGAAGGASYYYESRHGGTAPAATPITVQVGTISVGAP